MDFLPFPLPVQPETPRHGFEAEKAIYEARLRALRAAERPWWWRMGAALVRLTAKRPPKREPCQNLT